MRKQYRCADHEEKLLMDSLDKSATLLNAEVDGELVGTLRINWGHLRETIDSVWEPFSLSRFQSYQPNSFSFCSRLMMAPKFRTSGIFISLLRAAYCLGLEKGVLLNFIHCVPRHISFFEHLGFRRYKDLIVDANVGPQMPMVLFVEDVKHLMDVRSPLRHVAIREAIHG